MAWEQQVVGGAAGQTNKYSFIINHCVADCPSVNFQMVNNPELARCEFLGYYCKVGNYKDGCLDVIEPCKISLSNYY
jgi:hypothetical protein